MVDVGSERHRLLTFDSKERGITTCWMVWSAISICARQKMPIKYPRVQHASDDMSGNINNCLLSELKKRGLKIRVDDVAGIV
jgi:hypothetical protein